MDFHSAISLFEAPFIRSFATCCFANASKTGETVEKLAESGEVLVGEDFSREFALAFLAAYQ
jgi:hypothetical protein